MNTLRIPFLTLFIALPLLAGATTPTLKIIHPTKSPTTNGVLNASGTATGVEPVTNYFSFNSGAWTQATGTTNWTVPGLVLTPSSNTFAAFAQDATGALSKTNTVKFIYVVNVPITILTNGDGSVSPNDNGKPLEIGKKYSFSAKAAKGFGFTGWLLDGDPFTNSSHIFVTMQSNLTLTAIFRDITRPVCVITFPAVKQSLSNSPITVTGKASDNVGVTGVNYQFNGGGWNSATLLDPTNWEAPNFTLNVGANVVQAFAMDAAGNVSLTNTVNFNYVSNAPPPPVGPAPASLAGQVAEVNINGGSGPFLVNFGSSTFAQVSTNGGQEGSGTGNYTYTLLSSNTAQLNLSNLLPPQNGGGAQVTLTFTDDSDATFTDTNAQTGTFTLSNAPDLAPSPSSIITAQYVDISGNTNLITLGGGLFTNTDGLTYTNFGNYYFTPYSPLDMMLIENFTDPEDVSNVAYVQLDFSAAGTGDFFFNEFDSNNNFLNSDSGTFTILSSASQPSGKAPDSAAGLIWTANPNNGQPKFYYCFGTSTYSRTSSSNTDTNDFDVGIYSYVKTGANTAEFTSFETAPQSGGSGGNGGNNSDLITLDFSSAPIKVYDKGNLAGTITTSAANNLAPTSVASDTFTVKSTGNTATVTLNTDGTFTNNETDGTVNSGTYTYAPFSPIGGMLILSITSGSDNGNTAYVELTFSSSKAGNAFATTFDNLGNEVEAHGGTFTIP